MAKSVTFSFSEPLRYEAAIRAAEVDVLVTARGDFRAELTQIDFQRLWLQVGSDNLPRIFHSTVSAQAAPVVLFFGDAPGAFQHSRMDTLPGGITIVQPGAGHYHRSRGPSSWGAMSLAPNVLAATGYAPCGRALDAPAGTHRARTDAAMAGEVIKLCQSAAGLAQTLPSTLAHDEVARALEQTLIHFMVRCFTCATARAVTSAGGRQLAIMKRFEEVLAANCGRPLYLAEICASIGASERTLRASCQEQLGMGPVRYLWLRRMHQAHRALIRAASETATVTQIAMDHGFWELGRFAVAYRALFGESPSTSLRRENGGREATVTRAARRRGQSQASGRLPHPNSCRGHTDPPNLHS